MIGLILYASLALANPPTLAWFDKDGTTRPLHEVQWRADELTVNQVPSLANILPGAILTLKPEVRYRVFSTNERRRWRKRKKLMAYAGGELLKWIDTLARTHRRDYYYESVTHLVSLVTQGRAFELNAGQHLIVRSDAKWLRRVYGYAWVDFVVAEMKTVDGVQMLRATGQQGSLSMETVRESAVVSYASQLARPEARPKRCAKLILAGPLVSPKSR